MTEQEREIKTIKERNINVKLSDADVESLCIKAGKHGLTVGELFEQFTGDLVCGTYSNGSDERDYAQGWFKRCWFGMFPEETLLNYLLHREYDINEFITVCNELKQFIANPEEFSDDIENLEPGERLWFQEEYHEYIDGYLKNHEEADIEKEIDACRKWLDDMEEIKNDGKK